MRAVVGFALITSCGAAVALMAACNAISGASSLETCASTDCSELRPNGADGGPNDANVPPVILPDGGVVLPPTCTGNQTACAGSIAAQCEDGAWKQTNCAETCNGGKCAAWPSCRNTAGTGCGPTSESCCKTGAVPGGTFNRRNLPGFAATVSKFDLDLYEVTVGRFRAFVEAGGGTRSNPPGLGAGAHPKIANSGWQSVWTQLLPADTTALKAILKRSQGTWTDAPGANEHLPINYVPWFDAAAFCAYDGGRLPTNAEWGFAAAGGSEQRIYPWSTPPTSTITTQRTAYNCNLVDPAMVCPASNCSDGSSSPCDTATCIAPATCNYPPCTGCTFSDIAQVGALPLGAGRWGHFDLSGNMAELVLDIDGLLPIPCTDCARLPPSTLKGGGSPRLEVDFLANGGAWDFSSASSVRSTSFKAMNDEDVDNDVGFRCARDL